jgi:TRAP-type transport system periplasmic protein
MIRRRLLCGAFGLGIAALMGAAAVQAAEVTLRLGHAVFESHPFHDAAVRFRDAVAERSNGTIEIQIFPSRQLGDVKELTEGVQFGTVDMTVNSSSSYADLAPAVDALQLPWLIDSY